jgi:F-type H+-transporting ATPase subunit b
MPQFDFAFWPGQIFWLLVTFGVLYALLSSVFLPRVRGTIDMREDRIAGDLKEARRLRDAADADARAAEAELAEARARAHRLAQEARAKAQSEAARSQSKLEADLGARLGKAEARIRAARDEAMSHVSAIAEGTAQEMVSKLSGLAGEA